MITKDPFDDRLADGVIGTVMRFAAYRPEIGSEKVENFYLERERITPLVYSRPGGHHRRETGSPTFQSGGLGATEQKTDIRMPPCPLRHCCNAPEFRVSENPEASA